MLSERRLAADCVLIGSDGRSDSEDDFLVVSSRGASSIEVWTISGGAALLDALRRLAPRRVLLDFQVSFHRGLDLIRSLKHASPELNVIARVRSEPSAGAIGGEPLYFAVEVDPAKVSLHRLGPEGVDVTWTNFPTL
jgi:hypothetical protein